MVRWSRLSKPEAVAGRWRWLADAPRRHRGAIAVPWRRHAGWARCQWHVFCRLDDRCPRSGSRPQRRPGATVHRLSATCHARVLRTLRHDGPSPSTPSPDQEMVTCQERSPHRWRSGGPAQSQPPPTPVIPAGVSNGSASGQSFKPWPMTAFRSGSPRVTGILNHLGHAPIIPAGPMVRPARPLPFARMTFPIGPPGQLTTMSPMRRFALASCLCPNALSRMMTVWATAPEASSLAWTSSRPLLS